MAPVAPVTPLATEVSEPVGIPVVSFVPPAHVWPDSSLAAMLSLFAQEGVRVVWADPAAGSVALEKILATLPGDEAVIFGTSLHHVQCAHSSQCFVRGNTPNETGADSPPKKRLIVVDTGGTKGRTESLTRAQMSEVFATAYGTLADTFVVGSEYGMCELASQAWSKSLPHENKFTCNETLRVCAVDLATRKVVPWGEEGFLAFDDALNFESHGRIVTEDRGIAHDERTFTLIARAPDASVKGCSLNVKETFLFARHSEQSTKEFLSNNAPALSPAPAAKRPPRPNGARLFADGILGALASAGVSAGLSADLAFALREMETHFEKLALERETATKSGEAIRLATLEVCIVASANVPVVFLYPMLWAWALGATSLTLKLPSLREEDPVAVRMRSAMNVLVAELAPHLTGMDVVASDRLAEERPPASLGANSSVYVVFGTDATVETFRARHPGRVEGLGGFLNSATLGKGESIFGPRVVEELTRYLGRGCLTPTALFEPRAQKPTMTDDARALLASLSSTLQGRLADEGAPALASVLHQHDILEIRSVLARVLDEIVPTDSPAVCAAELVHVAPAACVVDLRSLPAHTPWHVFPYSYGGAGLVFLLPEDARANTALCARLDAVSTNPGLFDAHQGTPWKERLTRLFAARPA